jgi:hypothetical protein
VKPDRATVQARVAAADPARLLVIDEQARRALWARIAAEPQPPREPLVARAGARLRRALLLIPSIAVLAGAGLGVESAWCASCHRTTQSPALTTITPMSTFAPVGPRVASGDQIALTQLLGRRRGS